MVNVFSWGNSFSYEFMRAAGTAPIRTGQAPAMGGVQSGIPVLAWPTADGAYFQFLDLLGNPDPDPIAGRTLITSSPNVSNLQVADALVAYGALWTEGNQIKLRGVAQELGLVGQEVLVGNGTSASLAGYSFDTAVPDPALPGKTIFANGLTVAWIDTTGSVRVQRYQVVNDATGHPSGLVAAGIDGQAQSVAVHAAGDVVPASDAALNLGAGRDVKVVNLHTGDTLVTYVGTDNQAHARLYPPNGIFVPSDNALNGLTQADYTAVNTLIANLGAIPAGVKPQTVELGAGDFAIVWQNAAGGLEVRVFALPPDTPAGGALPPGWSPYTLTIAAGQLPGFNGEFALTGLGEDNANIVLSYTGTDGNGTGVFARVIDVNNIDGTPNSITLGAAAQINTNALGDQKLIGLTGLISERFMVSFVDADGSVQSRILDTRAPNQLLVGDLIRDTDNNGVFSAGDRVRSRPDVIVGTNGDDVIIGDLIDPQNGARFDDPLGSDDELHGGMGADILFGGGGFDIVDGGLDLLTDGRADPDPQFAGLTAKSFVDTAIYQGNFVNYNVFINGDGSYSVLDARFDDGANIIDQLADGTLNVDGWDLVSNVEVLKFLNGDLTNLRAGSYAPNLAGAQVALNAPGGFSLDTGQLYQLKTQDERVTGNVDAATLLADTNAALGVETVLTPVGWDLNNQARATSGFGLATTTAQEVRPQVAATIDGFVSSWEVPGAGTASTLNMQVYDALGLPILVDGTATSVIAVTTNARAGTAAIAGTGVGTAAVWIDNTTGNVVMRSYDLGNLPIGNAVTVNTAGAGTITDVSIGAQSTTAAIAEQVTVAWVQGTTIMAQRFGYPVDANGVQLAPVALGLDGTTSGVNTPFQIATNASFPGVAGLHDGEIAITYVTGTAPNQTINVRAFNLDGSEVLGTTAAPTVLQDITATSGTISTPPTLVSAGEGDIVVGWTETSGSVVTTKLAIYHITKGWASPEIMTLGIPTDAQNVSFAIAGDVELAVVATWREADGDVVGQRFEYGGELNAANQLVGVPVGGVFAVGSGVNAGATGAAGLLDGRVATVYGTGAGAAADIQAHLFDTRAATDPVIGRNAGGPRDFIVGTVFDDIIDGRDREDTIYGALGNDTLIGGINDDSLYGGAGNDDLVGGTGNDMLEGNDGDDLLMGGYGRDIISGGDGEDTLSYLGEQRAVDVDLEAGTVRSDAAVNGVTLPDLADTFNNAPAGFYTDAGLEDILGQIVEVNHELAIFDFVATNDIENIIGGFGNDMLRGNALTNKITGGRGDDVIDGRAGTDIAIFSGNRADYTITVNGTAITVVDNRGIDSTAAGDQLQNIEVLQFADQMFSPFGAAAPVVTGTAVLAPLLEDTSRVITAANFLQGASDPNGDALSVRNVTVDRGTVVANADGTWTYTPVANDDTGAVFSYQISDGIFTTNQTATLDISPVNDLAVTAPAVLVALTEDATRLITTADLTQGIFNPEGEPLSVSNLTVTRGSILSNGNGTWTYTPAANDETSVVFNYQVSDGGLTVAQTATLDLLPVNDLLATAPAVLAPLNEDTSRVITLADLTQGIFNPEGGALTVTGVTVSRGSIVANANGTWTFTPAANDDTSVVFSYQVSDGGLTVTQTATLDLLPVSDLAVSAPAVLTAVNEDTTRIITQAELTQGVLNPDGSALTIANLTVNRGTVVANGNGTWTYTPLANDDTSAVFSYQVSDGIVGRAQTATLDLLPVNDLVATAPAILAPLNEDTTRIITLAQLTQGIFNPEGGALTVSNVTVNRGTVAANLNGTWTFTPAANDDTSVVFSYQVSDGGLAVTQTATLDLLPVNDATTGAVAISFADSINDQSVLTASNTLQDIDGFQSVTYQWQSSTNGGTTWSNIAGANAATFTAGATQVGQLLRVSATALDVLGIATTVASAQTAIIGSALANTFTGTATENIIAGLGGNDTLNGSGGNDSLYGGTGIDTLNGDAGNDTLYGSLGDDTLNGNDGNDTLFGGAGIDTMSGNAGDDILFGEDGNDIMFGDAGKGTGGADTLIGGAGNDTIDGGDANDTFIALSNDGNDSYTGGNGVDTLNLSALLTGTRVNLGGATATVGGVVYTANQATSLENGTDTLNSIENVIGGASGDTFVAAASVVNRMTGGGGADAFVFITDTAAGNGVGARDVITDFATGLDKINLALIDANTITALDQAFSFIGLRGTAALTGGQVGYRYETVGGVEKTIVEGNIARTTNAALDTTVDFQIELDGRLTLAATDFVL